MNARRLLHIAVLGVFLVTFGFAGGIPQRYSCTTYTDENSLPTNLTKSIIQDSLGFLWIASDAGLIRFDGNHVITVSSLPTPYIKQFCQTNSYGLLTVTDLGIYRIVPDASTPRVELLIAGQKEQRAEALFFPKSAYEDASHRLWIGEPNAVAMYRMGALKRFVFEEQFRADSYVRSFQVFEHTDGAVLAVSERGYFFFYDEAADRFEQIYVDGWKNGTLIDAVLPSADGYILLGCSNGVWELNGSRSAGFSAHHRTTLEAVSSLQESRGRLFAGTWRSGLYEIGSDGRTAVRVDAFPFHAVNGLSATRDGSLLATSDEGVGLVRENHFSILPVALENTYIESVVHGNDAVFFTDGKRVFSATMSGDRPDVKPIFRTSGSLLLSLAATRNTLWFGYRDAFYQRYDRLRHSVESYRFEARGNRLITNIAAVSDDEAWMCIDGLEGVVRHQRGISTVYDASRGLHGPITVIRRFDNGTIMAAGSGVFSFNEASDRFTQIGLTASDTVVPSLNIADIALQGNDSLWLGTDRGLLLMVCGRIVFPPGLWQYRTLPIKSLTVDTNGDLWCGTDRGLLRYSNGEVSHFDKFSGLTNSSASFRSIIEDNGILWIGTTNGVGIGRVSSDNAVASETPEIIGIMAQDDTLDAHAASIELPYQSLLRVSVMSPDFPASSVIYRYRLLGMTGEWNGEGVDHNITYPSLPQGRYVLEVQAQQAGKKWSHSRTLEILVGAPWYRSPAAMAAYLVVVVLVAWLAGLRWVEKKERQSLQHRIAEHEENLREMFNTMQDVFFKCSMDGTILDITPSIERHSGYTREELLGQSVNQFYYHSEDRRTFLTLLRRRGSIADLEVQLRTKDGTMRWCSMNVELYTTQSVNGFLIRGSLRDVTARRAAEEALRASEEQHRNVLNQINDVVFQVGPDGAWTLLSGAWETITGFPIAGSLGSQASQFFEQKDRATFRSLISALQSGRQSSGKIQLRLTTARLEMRWVEVSASPQITESGAVSGVSGTFRDVTDRRLAQEQLQQSIERFELAVRGSRDGLWDWDIETNAMYFSPQWKAMIGYADDELPNSFREWEVRVHPDEIDTVHNHVMSFIEGSTEIYEEEFRFRHRDGSYLWILARATGVRNEQGRIVRMSGSHTDITERKHAEVDLRTALQKEKELGELKTRFVSMVSHEFRTPLTSILSSIELLERYITNWDPSKQQRALNHVPRIREGIKRMTGMLDDVLMFGKAEAGRLTFTAAPLHLEELCRQVVDDVRIGLPTRERDIAALPGDAIGEIVGDHKLIRHILTNLLSNGCKYSAPGTPVTMHLTRANDSISLSIADKGIGIPKDDLPHLFTRFHRAKNVGNIQGTGLGLSIVQHCAVLHGGSIQVISEEGQGTQFTFTFPYVPVREPAGAAVV